MKTKEEVREHCRHVGEEIERCVAEGKSLVDFFPDAPMFRFKVEKDGGFKVVGGELGGDDSGIVVSESGVTKTWMDDVVGYAFNEETRAAMVEFFAACRNA